MWIYNVEYTYYSTKQLFEIAIFPDIWQLRETGGGGGHFSKTSFFYLRMCKNFSEMVQPFWPHIEKNRPLAMGIVKKNRIYGLIILLLVKI